MSFLRKTILWFILFVIKCLLLVDHVFNRVWESISIVVPDNVIKLLLNVLGSSVITDLALVDHANEIEEEGCENDLAESFLEL